MRKSFINNELRPVIDNFIRPSLNKNNTNIQQKIMHENIIEQNESVILLIGTPLDNVLSIFAGFLASKQENFLFINLNALAYSIFLYSDYLIIDNKKIYYKHVTGVYCRFSGFEDSIEDNLPLEFHLQAERLTYLCNYQWPNVINRPFCDGSNNTKAYQLLKASESNIFKIPSTFILANKSNFEPSEKLIYKSTSGMRSHVVTFDREDREREITCPVQFQKYISGSNIRAHVIGNTVFPLKITSDMVDYRYAANQPLFQLIDLPSEINDKCVQISKLFGLTFSGVDLIQNENEYYFLEANTTPGYTFFEEFMDDNPISNRLLTVLKGEK